MEKPQVPLLDIVGENRPLKQKLLDALEQVIDSGRFLYGPDVTGLEQELAALCDVPHAIGCASGSDALLLALMALGVGPGDEVVIPSFTFFATASCVWRLGAQIVFADIDPSTFNIDPAAVQRVLTPQTKVIIPVHLFGQCADMDPIMSLAKPNGIHVVEDAAQAVSATYRGRKAGSMGDISCFSYYPTKNLGGLGDGGMLTTPHAKYDEALRLYAAHGMKPRYHHSVVGINSRLDTFQAACLRVKLQNVAQWNATRVANADRYQALFTEAGLDQRLRLPKTATGNGHVWNQYTVCVPDGQRDALRAHLADHGIGSEIYYPIPLHRQPCFQSLGYESGSLPVTEQAAEEVLSLPISPAATEVQQQQVVKVVDQFYHRASAAA